MVSVCAEADAVMGFGLSDVMDGAAAGCAPQFNAMA
jgi:hypothetical protein